MGRQPLPFDARLIARHVFHLPHVSVKREWASEFNALYRVALRRLDMYCAAIGLILFYEMTFD